MTPRLIVCLCVAALSLQASPLLAATPDPVGDWQRDDGESRIRIAPCGAALCATNIWVGDPNGREKVGDTLVLSLKPKSDSELDGDAYDRRRDMTYSMHMSVSRTALSTRGCILVGLICRRATWKHVR
jgi:uncharacterized protein (DUF2147 family)